ncbi:LRR domain containing protein [Parasponia andersonii]|uniref:LRR domain containing protein n=1 Tax=Parasponia andersonii TaxID=3476 RepID=A0A2P5CQL7_PARAD|nr:LRR domain containing protein [Parasponia andersonii]
MAESPVNFLVDKLAAFFENEVNLLRGVQEEVVCLKGDLEQMKAFLRIADALQEIDEELSVWLQARDIAYETEDLIDEYTLLQGHNHGPGLYGSLCRLACCIKNAKACYRIAAELNNINSRLRKINEVFTRDKLHFQAGGFKKLKILGLDDFEELRGIQLEPGALKFLKNLSIRQCQFLEKVPSGIENLTKLKLLEFFEMPAELFNILRPDIKDSDYRRVAHIPEVYSTYWREGEWKVYSLESMSEGENCPLPSTLIKTCDLHTRWK